MKISLGKEFEKIIYDKYYQMKSLGITEDFINHSLLGKIKIFINKKPEYCLSTLKFANDNIYIGD